MFCEDSRVQPAREQDVVVSTECGFGHPHRAFRASGATCLQPETMLTCPPLSRTLLRTHLRTLLRTRNGNSRDQPIFCECFGDPQRSNVSDGLPTGFTSVCRHRYERTRLYVRRKRCALQKVVCNLGLWKRAQQFSNVLPYGVDSGGCRVVASSSMSYSKSGQRLCAARYTHYPRCTARMSPVNIV